MIVDGIHVHADPSLTSAEIAMLVAEEQNLWRSRNKTIAYIEISREGDEIIISTSEKSPIRRVRRITGYLSNMDNFNDAKKAEVEHRVTHTL